MIPNRTDLYEIVQANLNMQFDEELALSNLIWNAHWAHLNYIFVDKKLFSQQLIDKVKEAGFNIITGQGDIARIKISW